MRGRQLASQICQALDFALRRTAQPDLLVAPLVAVERLYAGVEEAEGRKTLELVWCEGFRDRLGVRGEYLAGLLRGRKWAELGRF